jgi:hypothetical protein
MITSIQEMREHLIRVKENFSKLPGTYKFMIVHSCILGIGIVILVTVLGVKIIPLMLNGY